MIWEFIQKQLLGMEWLNNLVGNLISLTGIDTSSRLGGSIQFFIYDVLKISSMASAISVQTLGAQSSIPQLTKVTSELQKKGNHYDKRRYL